LATLSKSMICFYAIIYLIYGVTLVMKAILWWYIELGSWREWTKLISLAQL